MRSLQALDMVGDRGLGAVLGERELTDPRRPAVLQACQQAGRGEADAEAVLSRNPSHYACGGGDEVLTERVQVVVHSGRIFGAVGSASSASATDSGDHELGQLRIGLGVAEPGGRCDLSTGYSAHS